MRGRKPKPTELHKLEGTFNQTRHGRDRTGEVQADGDLDGEPVALVSESQRQLWRLALESSPKRILKQIDHELLLGWVIAADQMRIANEEQNRLDARSPMRLLAPDKDGRPAI